MPGYAMNDVDCVGVFKSINFSSIESSALSNLDLDLFAHQVKLIKDCAVALRYDLAS